MADSPKTPKKSLGAHLIPGNPGNSGGKKGRSGRKPLEFKQWCRDLINDPATRVVLESRAKAGDVKVFEFAAKYAEGLPAQPVQHEGKLEVIVKAVRE